MNIISLPVERALVDRARRFVRDNWELYVKRDIFDGDFEKKVIGEIGMRVITRYLDVPVENIHPILDNKPDAYDFLMDGGSYDSKTLGTATRPQPYFRYDVPEVQARKPVDYYVFASLLDDLSRLWIAGYISRDDFMKKSRWHKAGSRVEFSGCIFRCDTLDISILELEDIEGIHPQQQSLF
jgi:hypothetical protein